MIGKVESGGCKKGEILLVMPNKVIQSAVLLLEIVPNFFYRRRLKWNRSGRMILR